LALGIGMLVDNAIVVIENIYRRLSMGKDPKVAASDGAKEVGSAITASTLTTVAVFLPVVFITGIIGELFTEFALTISFSLFASLVVALTVVPMLALKISAGTK
ncbi:efflux RND transporter permease subunit, partial [Acinetobacter soli]